ncbi:hypothetical protein RFI_07075 [Reticulomyxa filosa]|uniref:TRAF-type domain-containing protein n=1 Tax=Reticulomyxa filosa TaxID=46433 RepID=X6NVK9_RETFI|nr:hypothetical protein RFI_07075 [Reticulomyxa filosa]|eukprot:ETO30046.1 hypothetical protein RFI_07075 [Reticulomyxa filosa]
MNENKKIDSLDDDISSYIANITENNAAREQDGMESVEEKAVSDGAEKMKCDDISLEELGNDVRTSCLSTSIFFLSNQGIRIGRQIFVKILETLHSLYCCDSLVFFIFFCKKKKRVYVSNFNFYYLFCFFFLKKKKSNCAAKKAMCPICTVAISRRSPIRNRLAERHLETLEVKCRNIGCTAAMQFAHLRQHMETRCPYRPVTCRFEPLGCPWKGLQKDRKQHHKCCQTSAMSPSQLLEQVKAKNSKDNLALNNAKQVDKRYIKICNILEIRCRNIVTRDVVVGAGQTFDSEGVVHSRPFHALNNVWLVEVKQTQDKHNITNPVDMKVRLVLLSHSHLKGCLLLQICIFQGPDTETHITFPPLSLDCEFHRKQIHSRWATLSLLNNTSTFSESTCCEINFRFILVDKRRGQISRSFRTDDYDDSSESSFGMHDDFTDDRNESIVSGSESQHSEAVFDVIGEFDI